MKNFIISGTKKFLFLLLVTSLLTVACFAQVDSILVKGQKFYSRAPEGWNSATDLPLDGRSNFLYTHPILTKSSWGVIGVTIRDENVPELKVKSKRRKEPLYPTYKAENIVFNGFSCMTYSEEGNTSDYDNSYRLYYSYLYKIDQSTELTIFLDALAQKDETYSLRDTLFTVAKNFFLLNKNAITKLSPNYNLSLGALDSTYFYGNQFFFRPPAHWQLNDKDTSRSTVVRNSINLSYADGLYNPTTLSISPAVLANPQHSSSAVTVASPYQLYNPDFTHFSNETVATTISYTITNSYDVKVVMQEGNNVMVFSCRTLITPKYGNIIEINFKRECDNLYEISYYMEFTKNYASSIALINNFTMWQGN